MVHSVVESKYLILWYKLELSAEDIGNSVGVWRLILLKAKCFKLHETVVVLGCNNYGARFGRLFG